jgi:hypothetical protein
LDKNIQNSFRLENCQEHFGGKKKKEKKKDVEVLAFQDKEES